MSKGETQSRPGARLSHGLPAPSELDAAPGYQVRRLHQAYVAAWFRLVDPVTTGPQLAVLIAINNYPGIEQGSLGSSVSLDRSTMASIVRRLEERGLIIRERHAKDGRKRLLHLTETGKATLHEVNRRARELDVTLMAGYDAADQERLRGELTTLAIRWEALVED